MNLMKKKELQEGSFWGNGRKKVQVEKFGRDERTPPVGSNFNK